MTLCLSTATVIMVREDMKAAMQGTVFTNLGKIYVWLANLLNNVYYLKNVQINTTFHITYRGKICSP